MPFVLRIAWKDNLLTRVKNESADRFNSPADTVRFPVSPARERELIEMQS